MKLSGKFEDSDSKFKRNKEHVSLIVIFQMLVNFNSFTIEMIITNE